MPKPTKNKRRAAAPVPRLARDRITLNLVRLLFGQPPLTAAQYRAQQKRLARKKP